MNSTAAKRAGYRIQFRPSEEDLNRIREAALQLPKKIRSKIVRKGLREWGEKVKRSMKSLAHFKAKRTKRDIAVKIKTYRKGRIWCGVGVRKDGSRVGKRSHLYDQGWRPPQKGLVLLSPGVVGPKPTPKLVRKWKGNKNARIVPFSQQRGWRKGVKKRDAVLGARIYRRLYITRPAKLYQPKAVDFITNAVEDALMELPRG